MVDSKNLVDVFFSLLREYNIYINGQVIVLTVTLMSKQEGWGRFPSIKAEP